MTRSCTFRAYSRTLNISTMAHRTPNTRTPPNKSGCLTSRYIVRPANQGADKKKAMKHGVDSRMILQVLFGFVPSRVLGVIIG